MIAKEDTKKLNPSLLDAYLKEIPLDTRSSAAIAYLAALDHLLQEAPSIARQIINELRSQRSCLKLIASENYSSLTVQLAMGNLLTDKYCEGYPYHRFYAGCENVDAIESEAQDLAKKLFNAEHAYVQPHSGADANLVAFWTILVQKIQNKEIEKLGKKTLEELSEDEMERIRQLLCNQKILGMSLSSGGHLTHGYRHNVSAKMMRAYTYDVDPLTGLIDYKKILDKAKEVKPTILLAGYSAYSRLINFATMREIADEVGAVFMVDMAHFAGLVAGGVFQGDYNPIPYAHIVTTTTHKTLCGPRGGMILCKEEFRESIDKGCPLVLGGPLPHVLAAKAIAFREALKPEFKIYSKNIVTNSQALALALQDEGLNVVTGGTDNHLLLVRVDELGLTGRQAESILRECGITLNRNMLPFDPNGPWYTSGIRLGTPALTKLGMGTNEMKEIGKLIATPLKTAKPQKTSQGVLSKAKAEIDPQVIKRSLESVSSLLNRFPLYPEIKIGDI